jgi:hypothetical protein
LVVCGILVRDKGIDGLADIIVNKNVHACCRCSS